MLFKTFFTAFLIISSLATFASDEEYCKQTADSELDPNRPESSYTSRKFLGRCNIVEDGSVGFLNRPMWMVSKVDVCLFRYLRNSKSYIHIPVAKKSIEATVQNYSGMGTPNKSFLYGAGINMVELATTENHDISFATLKGETLFYKLVDSWGSLSFSYTFEFNSEKKQLMFKVTENKRDKKTVWLNTELRCN